jgi:16S rRNA (cytosine967-C5)-methyltransferase
MSELTPERVVAMAVLVRTFRDGDFTEIAFREEVARHSLEGRQRALAQYLSFGAVQRKGTADQIWQGFSQKRGSIPDAEILAALRLGIFELLFAGGTPDHSAVDQAVEAARAGGGGHATGYVNAILRRTVRERKQLLDRLADDTTQKAARFAHSMPDWIVSMWWDELGPDLARTALAGSNLPGERAIRVNTERIGVSELIEALGDDLEIATPGGGWPLEPVELLLARGNLSRAEELAAEGLLVIQSQGSAAVAEVLDPQPGERILDLCSGPGIKTGQLGCRVGPHGNVLAVEPDPARADEVARQVERLGYHNTLVVEADGRDTEILGTFDGVLVDAPCTDLGAMASRPDVRWRKTPSAMERLLPLQAALLDRGADCLAPGGRLVYSTCTISKRENRDQAVAAAERNGLEVEDLGNRSPGLADPADSRFLQILPGREATTGFFIASFRKSSDGQTADRA